MKGFNVVLEHHSQAARATRSAYDSLRNLTPGRAAYRAAEKHVDICAAVEAALQAVIDEICPEEDPEI